MDLSSHPIVFLDYWGLLKFLIKFSESLVIKNVKINANTTTLIKEIIFKANGVNTTVPKIFNSANIKITKKTKADELDKIFFVFVDKLSNFFTKLFSKSNANFFIF